MDELRDIYDRIAFLRGNGVRMKDIAAGAGWQPSVLSALYTTVLPAYIRNRAKGLDEAGAVNEALLLVNNVSRKKLYGSASALRAALAAMEAVPEQKKLGGGNPYMALLKGVMGAAAGHIAQLGGVYLSYSRSSASDALKVEPYFIGLSADGSYIEVIHRSAYGVTHHGFAVLNGMHHLYIVFNESRLPQLSLFNICLKLPLYDRPRMLRGVYTCCDYNYNPVARRILFVRTDESVGRTEFAKAAGCLKRPDELTGDERAYYQYTCGEHDIIRTCSIPSPKMNSDDLSLEKSLLE